MHSTLFVILAFPLWQCHQQCKDQSISWHWIAILILAISSSETLLAFPIVCGWHLCRINKKIETNRNASFLTHLCLHYLIWSKQLHFGTRGCSSHWLSPITVIVQKASNGTTQSESISNHWNEAILQCQSKSLISPSKMHFKLTVLTCDVFGMKL